jgi:hypothetical protein
MTPLRRGTPTYHCCGSHSRRISYARLTYNERLGGYEVNIGESELRDAPKYGRQDDNWDWSDQRVKELDTYYRS